MFIRISVFLKLMGNDNPKAFPHFHAQAPSLVRPGVSNQANHRPLSKEPAASLYTPVRHTNSSAKCKCSPHPPKKPRHCSPPNVKSPSTSTPPSAPRTELRRSCARARPPTARGKTLPRGLGTRRNRGSLRCGRSRGRRSRSWTRSGSGSRRRRWRRGAGAGGLAASGGGKARRMGPGGRSRVERKGCGVRLCSLRRGGRGRGMCHLLPRGRRYSRIFCCIFAIDEGVVGDGAGEGDVRFNATEVLVCGKGGVVVEHAGY
jgi:hypothetical protein